MSATIIDGTAVAQSVRAQVRERASAFAARRDRPPALATILAGDDQASQIYIRAKRRACEQAGIASEHREFPSDVSTEELIEYVTLLAGRDDIDGILVQLPLPQQVDERQVLEAIPPSKDVDGLHPQNVGRLVLGQPTLACCTPAGIIELLDAYDIPIAGRSAVVVGRSNMVGKPVAALLLARNATVTICHSRTKDLTNHTRQADILVAAVGSPGLIDASMVKPGACVIDVGINRRGSSLVGDVEFSEVAQVAGAITPVPGGVGPMTIAMLLSNTVSAAELRLAASGNGG